MRYIDIDSRGTSSNISVSKSNVSTLGRFTFDYSYSITHILLKLNYRHFVKNSYDNY